MKVSVPLEQRLTKATLDEYYSPTMQELLHEIEKDYRSIDAQAELAGVSVSTIYNWRNGKTHRPRIDTLEKVAVSKGGRIGFIAGKGRTN